CLFFSINTVGVHFQHLQLMAHFILTGQICSAPVCMELAMTRVSKDDKTSQDRKYKLKDNKRYKLYNKRNFTSNKSRRNVRYNTRKENDKCVHNPLQQRHCNHIPIRNVGYLMCNNTFYSVIIHFR